ncbi:MAG: right-handed parallel beta-helix repeat-containing protein, partial [Saprospiraceae bacterium]|nr:right-handed parallel beta-helix repeat-containing protein [Saprospiraceae bacterium]
MKNNFTMIFRITLVWGLFMSFAQCETPDIINSNKTANLELIIEGVESGDFNLSGSDNSSIVINENLTSDPAIPATYPAPSWSAANYDHCVGENLSFTLTGLPDPSIFGGSYSLQLNWQIGPACNSGSTFAETVNITNTTTTFNTSYTLAIGDHGKFIRANFSFINGGSDFLLGQLDPNCATVNVYQTPVGTIAASGSAPTTICENGTYPLTFTATTGTGPTYDITIDGTAFTVTSGVSFDLTEGIDFTGDAASISLTQIVDNGIPIIEACTTTNGLPINSIIGPTVIEFDPGTIVASGPTTICINPAGPDALEGDGSPNGSLASGDGTITYDWESSLDNFATIASSGLSTSANYNPGNISTDRYYRRKATSVIGSTSCVLYSNTILITVNNITTVGTLSADQTICPNSNASTISFVTPSVADGDLSYVWEESTDNVNFTPVAPAETGTTYTPMNVAVTTYFRVVVKSTLNTVECTATTPSMNVSVDASSGTNGTIKLTDGLSSATSFYCTIQEAIDAATDAQGDVIDIPVGIYTENILVDKAVTINGPQVDIDPRNAAALRIAGSASEAIIDGGGSGIVVEITSPNVELNGLEIRNGDVDLISSPSAAPVKTAVVVNYCIIHGSSGDEGIQLRNVTDGSIAYNRVYDTDGDGINLCCESTNTSIDNNEIYGSASGDAAMYLYTNGPDISITNNLLYNNTADNGIMVGRKNGDDDNKNSAFTNNAIVSDNIVTGHTGSEVGIYVNTSRVNVIDNVITNWESTGDAALYFRWDIKEILATGNTISDNGRGVKVSSGVDALNAPSFLINKNLIFDNTDGLSNGSGGVVDATCNWWGANDADVADDATSDDVQFLPYSTVGTDPLNCLGIGHVIVYEGATTNVRSTHITIQEAINATSTMDGDRIEVSARTYKEMVDVTVPNLTIKGANSGTSGCSGRVPESIVDGGVAGTAFTISADGVTIDGFALDGLIGVNVTAQTGFNIINNYVNTDYLGIVATAIVPNSTTSIVGNCVELTTQVNALAPAPGITTGIVLNNVSGTDDILVDNNDISDGFYGYFVHNVAATDQSINDGSIAGVMQGIVISNSLSGAAPYAPSTIDIDGVTMDGFIGAYPDPPNTGLGPFNFHAGIYSFTGGGTTTESLTININNVTIDGTGKPDANSAGISVSDFSTAPTGNAQTVVITNSMIKNNDNRGLYARANVDVTISESTLQDNGGDAFFIGGNLGFAIIAREGASVTATNNFIIQPSSPVTDVYALSASALTSTITANNNSITGSDVSGTPKIYGASASSPSSINATCNWWGGISPTVAPLMTGNAVTYELFQVDGTDDGSDPTDGFQPLANQCSGCSSGSSVANVTVPAMPLFYCTIQEAIDDADPGNTILVSSGTFTEDLIINKSITLNGANVGVDPNTPARIGAETRLLNGSIVLSGANTIIIDGFEIYQTNDISDVVLMGGPTTATLQNTILNRQGVTTGVGIRAITTSAGTGVKTIANNLFTGDDSNGLYGGHTSWNSGMYINGSASTVAINNNVFENCRTALNIDDMDTGISLSGNTFSNSGTYVSFGGTTPTSGQFTFGPNEFNVAVGTIFNLSNVDPGFRLDVSAGTYGGEGFAALPLSTLFEISARTAHMGRPKASSPFVNNGLVTYVQDNLYAINLPSFSFADNLNLAIGLASIGDVLNIQEGTYIQNVIVDKAITLSGPNAGVDCGSRVAEAIIAPTSGTPVAISVDGVTLNGF